MPMKRKAKTTTRVRYAVMQSGRLPACNDHHSGGRVLQHEVDRVAEDTTPPRPARGAHDDDLALAARCLVDDGTAGVTRADEPLGELHAVELCDRCRSVESLVGQALLRLEPS